MRVLLDTNVILDLARSPEVLNDDVVRMLSDDTTTCVVPVVAVWEIAIKWRLGKLTLPTTPSGWARTMVREFGAEVLPVTLNHAVAVAELPDHHRDPFDRLLIAQATVERLPIVTSDSSFAAYDVDVVTAR